MSWCYITNICGRFRSSYALSELCSVVVHNYTTHCILLSVCYVFDVSLSSSGLESRSSWDERKCLFRQLTTFRLQRTNHVTKNRSLLPANKSFVTDIGFVWLTWNTTLAPLFTVWLVHPCFPIGHIRDWFTTRLDGRFRLPKCRKERFQKSLVLYIYIMY